MYIDNLDIFEVCDAERWVALAGAICPWMIAAEGMYTEKGIALRREKAEDRVENVKALDC